MNATLNGTYRQGATPGITAQPAIGNPRGFEVEATPVSPSPPARNTAMRTEQGPSPAPATDPQHAPEFSPLRVLNGAVYFNGACETCRPFCAAVCCRGYSFVSITEAEAQSGRYVYKEESTDCNCSTCQRMRDLGIKYTLLKRQDGSCFYLDGANRCSIYDDRPATCKQYSCVNVPFRISP